MAIPESGPISLAMIQTEFGGPTSPISLGSYYKNGAYVTATTFSPNVPTSGKISLSDFYGSRRLTLYTLTYTGDGSFVLPGTFVGNVIVNSMLGAGGGGGGGDGGRSGYTGYAGGTVVNGNISASAGDTVSVFTGAPGAGGVGNNSGAPGGAGGISGWGNWSSLELLSNPINFQSQNNAYCAFLNQYGIWNYSVGYPSFDQTVTVTFPYSSVFTVTGSADNYGSILLDGTTILSINGYGATDQTQLFIAQGAHAVRLLATDTGLPGSIGATITGGFYGGNGGSAGTNGSSGGGGGGGAASIIAINGTIQAVAPGGGGGGGSGYRSDGRPNQNSRGNNGTYNGGNGASKDGDGGGAGGGGAGYNGGAGGAVYGGDDGAFSGENGAWLPAGGTASMGSNGGAGSPGNGSSGTGGVVTVSYYA
jgi:hypothetical protein